MCSKNINNLFLLGAGVTKAVFPDAPLNKCLLQAVMNYRPSSPLQKYCREYKTDDIEILLTRLDLEIVQPKTKKQTALQIVRKDIEQQLAEYFKQFRFDKKFLEEKSWLDCFVKLLKKNDVIVTTNYDCLLEGLLDFKEVWTPNKGYPKLDCPSSNCPSNPMNILIYKIHGSEHFVEIPIFSHEGVTENTTIKFQFDESIYPSSGMNAHFDSNIPDLTGPYIIAPSYIKNPHHYIERIMIDALQVADKSNNLIIIGSGLRLEDSFLWLLLSAFIESCIPEKPKKKLFIVDPYAKEISNKITKHPMWDIDDLLSIIPIEKKIEIECAVEELIEKLNNSYSL